MQANENILSPCKSKHENTKDNGICVECGYNTLHLINKELKDLSLTKAQQDLMAIYNRLTPEQRKQLKEFTNKLKN